MNQATLVVAACMKWLAQSRGVGSIFAGDPMGMANGASGDYIDQGDFFLCKEIPANLTFDSYDGDAGDSAPGSMYLAGDMRDDPGPLAGFNILNPIPEDYTVLPMLRVIKDIRAWPSNGPAWAPNCLRFGRPDVESAAKGFLAGYYFPGPGGGEKNVRGTGHYWLGLAGTGTAHLLEKVLLGPDFSEPKWKRRFVFQYAPPYAASQTTHRIIIHAYSGCDLIGNLIYSGLAGKVGCIHFDVSSGDQGMVTGALRSRVQSAATQGVTYYPPTWITGTRNNGVAGVGQYVKLDIRQDILMNVQISVGCV